MGIGVWKHAIVSLQGGQKKSDQIPRVYITKAKPKWCDVPRGQGGRKTVCVSISLTHIPPIFPLHANSKELDIKI